MKNNPTKRIINLIPELIQASNIERALDFKVTDEGAVEAEMAFNHWAHLSFTLFAENALVDAEKLQVSFEARVAMGTTELWSALVDEHSSWHSPLSLGRIDESWRCVTLTVKEYLSLTNSFRTLKLIVRSDCRLEVRSLQLSGVAGIDSLKIVIPWFGRDAARIRARDIALDRLMDQSKAFDLVLLELLFDKKPATFFPKQKNYQHILIHKDRRYQGIFHKESLFNYYLNHHSIDPYSGYMFMDSDVYADSKLWLTRIIERLSRAMTDEQALLLQPFSRIIDTGTGATNHSFCSAESRAIETLAINPGLCWATTGKVLLERHIQFPHKLVTGIADAVFVASYVKSSDRIPYLPPFSVSSIVANNRCDWDFIDEDLNHVNHGENVADSYAMRDLLWQACLDHGVFQNDKPVAEDGDGFLYFPKQNCSAQICLARMMDHQRPDSVLAHVLRTFGAPSSHVQHISVDSGANITEDPRGLSLQERLLWECVRSHFRLYALGVEKTTVASQHFSDSIPGFSEIPFLRELVSDHASHPVILLTAPTGITYPSMLSELNKALRSFDIVFFRAIPETFDANSCAARTTATPPSPVDTKGKSARIAAVAFTLAWWEENQIALPHGLLTGGNYLDCLYQLIKNKWPKVPLADGHCRIISFDARDRSLITHNQRVTDEILKLHDKRFLSLGPIDMSHRKIRVEPNYTKHFHQNKAAMISTLGRLHTVSGVLFNPLVSTVFHNGHDVQLPYREKWSGIIHGIFDTPEHLPRSEYELLPMLQDARFTQSLEHCAGVFTHSNYLRQRILDSGYWKSDVPIGILPYTVLEPESGFRADWYWGRSHQQLYAIGYFAKRLSSFFDLDEGDFAKILIAPTHSRKFQEYLRIEKVSSGKPDSLKLQNCPNKAACDEILSRNPVFLDHYDLSASTILTECIVRNTPVIMRRHPAAEEVLGAEYPLFFSTLDQAASLLNENKILEGHVYLANIPKRDFYHSALLEKLQTSEIYRCL